MSDQHSVPSFTLFELRLENGQVFASGKTQEAGFLQVVTDLVLALAGGTASFTSTSMASLVGGGEFDQTVWGSTDFRENVEMIFDGAELRICAVNEALLQRLADAGARPGTEDAVQGPMVRFDFGLGEVRTLTFDYAPLTLRNIETSKGRHHRLERDRRQRLFMHRA